MEAAANSMCDAMTSARWTWDWEAVVPHVPHPSPCARGHLLPAPVHRGRQTNTEHSNNKSGSRLNLAKQLRLFQEHFEPYKSIWSYKFST